MMKIATAAEYRQALDRFETMTGDMTISLDQFSKLGAAIIEYQGRELARRTRKVLHVGQLTDGDLDAIRNAEIPAEAALYNHEI